MKIIQILSKFNVEMNLIQKYLRHNNPVIFKLHNIIHQAIYKKGKTDKIIYQNMKDK